MSKVYVNNSNKNLTCKECKEDIEPNDYCYKDGSEILCECCHEDRHEYDNED